MIIVGVMAFIFGASGLSASYSAGGFGGSSFRFRYSIEDRVLITLGVGLVAAGALFRDRVRVP